jgi:hypothetical protein
MWALGENGELINLALVSVVKAQLNQGSWQVLALAQGSIVCVQRGSEAECKRRVEAIKAEMLKAGARFV